MTPAGRGASRRTPESRMLTRTRWKLVAWSTASTLVLLALLGSALYLAVERQLRTESEDRLEQRASVMAQRIPFATQGLPADAADRLVHVGSGCPPAGVDGQASGPQMAPGSRAAPAPTTGPGRCVLTFDVTAGDQAVRWAMPINVVADPSLPGVLIGGPASGTIAMVAAGDAATGTTWTAGFRELDMDGTPMRVFTTQVDIEGQPLQLRVAQDRTLELGTLQSTLLVLLAGGAASLIAAGGLGYRYAGRALVPIRDALRHQREFAADASHELRTPLSVIRSNVEALRRGPLDTPGREMLADIDSEADRMARLVDQLLLLARTDSGAQEVEVRQVDLGEETADAIDPLARLAQVRGVEVELDVAPTPLEGDPTRLRQLAGILVDNAIRHAPAPGHVWVRVGRTQHHATLTVDDDGPGVRPEDRARVFDRFWRAADAPAGGSGLGLAIAAWIVDRHAGSIHVSDRPGGGARFQVRLPVT
ncbi:MAG: HAMP domain-containing sensor histidine kinase [Candidatus Limnocylindrales bacterium]